MVCWVLCCSSISVDFGDHYFLWQLRARNAGSPTPYRPGTRCRLAKVLNARRYLTQQQRVQLYTLCVRSAALYGLGAVGLHQASLRRLHQFEVRHLRALVRSPVHLTRESTQQLYKRLKLKLPGYQLLQVLRNQSRRAKQDEHGYKAWLHSRASRLSDLLCLQQSGLREVEVHQELACPTCGQYFSTLKDLRQHHTKTHKVRLQQRSQGPAARLRGLRTQDHCLNHMPICKHCKTKLSNWHNFRVHIITSCPVLHAHEGSSQGGSAEQHAAGPSTAPGSALQPAAGSRADYEATDTAPVVERPAVVQLLSTVEWKSILCLDGIKEHLRNHCAFCSQWLSSAPGALNKHIISLHPDIACLRKDAVAQSITLCEGKQRPCGACGARPLHRTQHRCRVLYQLCLLRYAHLQALRGPACISRRLGSHHGTDRSRGPAGGPPDVSTSCGQTGAAGGTGCGHECSPSPGTPRPGGRLAGNPGKGSELKGSAKSTTGTAAGQDQQRPGKTVDSGGVGFLDKLGSKQSGAHHEGTSERGRKPSGECSAPGPHLHAARGRAEPEEDRNGLYPHPGGRPSQCHPGPGRPIGAALQNDGRVEDQARARTGQQLLATYFVHRPPHVLRAQGPRGNGLSRIPGTLSPAGFPSSAGWQSSLELPEMELRQGGAGDIRAASFAGCRTPLPADGFENQHRSSRCASSFPQLEEAGGAAQIGGDLLPGNWNEGSTSPHLLSSPAAAVLQLKHPADQDEAEAGQDGETAPREHPPGKVSSATGSKRRAASDLPGSNAAAVAQREGSRQKRPAGGQRPRRQGSWLPDPCSDSLLPTRISFAMPMLRYSHFYGWAWYR